MVSVRLMTYNHELYIRKAMNGIMMQEVEFPVEVVIGDDFSNDRTLNIIHEYDSSSKIHLKILKRKVGDSYWKERQLKGRFYNFIDILENCTGKYIAFLDGDDYWTDPLKLHKQVKILENYDNVGLVHTAYKVYLENEKKIYRGKEKFRKPYNWPTATELLQKNSIATLTTMFRKSILVKILPLYKKMLYENDWPMADYPLWLLIANGHEIRYLDEVTSVYRKRRGSLSAHSDYANRKQFLKKTLHIQRYFAQKFNFSIEIKNDLNKAYYLRQFNLAWKFNEWDYIIKYYGRLNLDELNLKYVVKYLLALLRKYSEKFKNFLTD